MILLDPTQIQAHLATLNFKKSYELHSLKSIDSTNQFLIDLPANQQLTICCAEEQTAGRGRLGRHWNSPLGENIYCSLRWSCPSDLKQLSGLSLVAGLAIIHSLQASPYVIPNPHVIPNPYVIPKEVRDLLKDNQSIAGDPSSQAPLDDVPRDLRPLINGCLTIKWPNDLVWKHKKLCGILIELSKRDSKTPEIILGIGLNVNSSPANSKLSDKPWCSLFEITGLSFDRNRLIAGLINSLTQYLDRFFELGFESFLSEWQRFDALNNQWITVTEVTKSVSGYARGVNALGHLCLEDKQGILHEIAAGEATISLR